jgi:hypothetical protein
MRIAAIASRGVGGGAVSLIGKMMARAHRREPAAGAPLPAPRDAAAHVGRLAVPAVAFLLASLLAAGDVGERRWRVRRPVRAVSP